LAVEGIELEKDTDQRWKGRRIYVLAAWASPLAAVVISVVLWLWFVNHVGTRGERAPAVLLFYLFLLVSSAAGGLAGIISLFGIRSWGNAVLIVPGALLGICINGCNALMCLYAYALEGRNMGG
jgi:lipopolysaccharide export LptBFGC system permease protein LptF